MRTASWYQTSNYERSIGIVAPPPAPPGGPPAYAPPAGAPALASIFANAQSTSTVALFAKSAEALEPFRKFEGVSDFDDGGLKPWTDDYSDILGPFLSKMRLRSE